MLDVHLSPGIPGGKWARLRPLCGHDEALIDDPGAMDVVVLIDRLLVDAPGTAVGPGSAAELAVCDCDRLCASIFMEYFGELIESRVTCRDCQQRFDMSFSLRGLMQNPANPRSETSGPDDKGVFTTRDGRRFRLPTAGEQRRVGGLGAEAAVAALFDRCVVDGDAEKATDTIERAMQEVGSVLDLDLDAICPHCDRSQAVRFEMQSYLFGVLGYEKQFLSYEVHRIATAYGWGYAETLSLRREERRKFVQLIESERAAQRARSWTDI